MQIETPPADFERSWFSLKLSEARAAYTFNIECPFENSMTHLKYRCDDRNEELWTLFRASQLRVSKQPSRHGQRWGLASPGWIQGWEKSGGEHWTASALASFLGIEVGTPQFLTFLPGSTCQHSCLSLDLCSHEQIVWPGKPNGGYIANWLIKSWKVVLQRPERHKAR